MKVLIISPGFHPVTGEHGGAIENLINIFLKENDVNFKNEIVVYSAKIKDVYDRNIYRYTTFRTVNIKSIRYRTKHIMKNLLKIITRQKKQRYYIDEIIKDIKHRKEENYYDCIIFENGEDFIVQFKKKIKTKSKIVLHLHNDHINLGNKDSSIIIDNVDEIWAVSKFIKKQIDSVKLTEKVKVLYNTINYDIFNKEISLAERKELEERYNILDSDYIFLYVGRVMDAKGTLELVKAFDEVNRNFCNIKLLIVGGSISLKNSSDYYDSVKKVASSNSNIIFTGQIKNYELYKYYQISDCQIIPSKWKEPFGLIALEGIASKIKIISSNTGGLPEILGDCCLYVDSKNLINDLVKQMKRVLNDKTEIDKLSYDNIIKKFSKENYNNTFNKLIK